ncbi:hypothetical protein [Enhygromyxa salina]|nr:hypothetical protein [Enhygromyxa salina]
MTTWSLPVGATSCLSGELVDLLDPVVMVIDGPGDAVQEQDRWDSFVPTSIRGMHEMSIGQEGFELERVE